MIQRCHLAGILVLLNLLSLNSADYWRHPDADISLVEKIKKDGYPVEVHEVITEDHYILQIVRVRYGLNRPKTLANRSAVLLSHGLSSAPDFFFTLGRREALAYYLADYGFDVWALGSRGSRPGKHKNLDWNLDRQFWRFSWHHVGVYDFPAAIDYIIANTDQKQVFFIGHSAGNTAYFVMGSERPVYNDKIKVSVSYGPTTILDYVEYPIAKLAGHLVTILQRILEFVDLEVLFPYSELLSPLLKDICSTGYRDACAEVVNLIGGQHSSVVAPENACYCISYFFLITVDMSLTTLIFNAFPTRISTMQALHYLQLIHAGGFRQYDYGKQKNLRMYGRKSPPDYNFSNCTAPVALMYGELDSIATKRGVMAMEKLLPNVVLSYQVPFKEFNHVDFLFASNVSVLVYKRTAQLFSDFDNGKILDRRKTP